MTKPDKNFSQREPPISPTKATLEQQRELLVREAMYGVVTVRGTFVWNCTVTITTQPNDVAVPPGGTAVFTCVVNLRNENANTNDVKWDNMGDAITHVSTDPYMVNNDFETFGQDLQLNSTLTIRNVNTQHAGLYQFVLSLNDGDVMSREASLNLLTATITTQPSDVTVCAGEVALFTCVVDRNGTNITSDDVKWQQIRVGNSPSDFLKRVPFNITTTISGDILTSTLTITGVTASNVLGTSSYHCVVNDMTSRNASLHFSTGPPVNIRFNEISSTSFVVQWDEVDDADWYIVNWRDDGGSVNESTTSLTSNTIIQLSPNTTYSVTVTAGNICGSGTVSDILIVTTNVTLLVGPSISSVMTTTSNMNSMVAMATPATPPVMTTTSSMSSMVTILLTTTTTTSVASSSGGGGGAGGIIGGVVGGIIAVVTVIINIVVLYWFCVYKKKGGADLEKETYAALQSPTGSFAKDTFPESHYDAVDKPGTRVVPHQSSASGVEYAVSTKTASMASLSEPPPEYAYVAVDKKKHIVGIIPRQSSATGVQYAVSTKATEAKEPHRYDATRDEPANVPHQTAATGAVYAVSSKSATHQHDDVKYKSPQGISYAEIQHGSTSGVKVSMGDDPVVKYTQVA